MHVYNKKQVSAVVLAAGHGTRMFADKVSDVKSEVFAKVLVLLNGKPLLFHTLENIIRAGIRNICIVVGPDPLKGQIKSQVMNFFNNHVDFPNDIQFSFVEQNQPKGTAHALQQTEELFRNMHFEGNVLVCCGDMPVIQDKSFRTLIDSHLQNKYKGSVLTAYLKHPKDHSYAYGRILRNSKDEFLCIREYKDASTEERTVQEINTGAYVFQSPEVFAQLKNISNKNAQNEYYLPDLIELYLSESNGSQEALVGSYCLPDEREAQGVNTLEELENLEIQFQSGSFVVSTGVKSH